MLKGSDVIGTPVFIQDTGEQINQVEDVIFDPETNRLLGFIIDKGEKSSEAHLALWEGIQKIEPDKVTLSSLKYVIPANYAPPLKHLTENENILNQARIITTTGQELGQLSDVYFDVQTGQVEGYEVTQRMLAGILAESDFLPVAQVVEVGQETILVKPEVADTLLKSVS
jgi:uncharacterized protein YrrD